jgi:Phospholipid-translocating P-type ATPase C-terminal
LFFVSIWTLNGFNE